MPVTPDNMVGVEIKRGWLMETLSSYLVRADLPLDAKPPFRSQFWDAVASLDFELATRNQKYESAWLTDYILTSLADLKDKLYRLGAATRKGAWIEWDDNKRRGTYYDILARTFMLMALEDANSKNLEGVLDDD